MAVYTVHQPPLKKYDNAPDPERFVFVRDGFSFWAFVFGPLWMLRHRMWLTLLGYVVVTAIMQVTLQLVGASAGGAALASLLLALLVGIEAGTLRRFTLSRRRWRNLGTIVGSDREQVEQRFFDAWVKGDTVSPVPVSMPRPAGSPAAASAPPTEVIGLFPQPGAHR